MRKIIGLITFLSMFALLTPMQPASAFTNNAIVLQGHGWGHGRGMGQYGALGYAINSGWSYSQILDHYYSNTTMSTTGNPTIGVDLVSEDPNGSLIVTANNPFDVGGSHTEPGGTYVQINIVSGTSNFLVSTGTSCGGPWTSQFTQAADGSSNITVSPPTGSPGNDQNMMLQRCVAGTRTYRGTLIAHNESGALRIVNNVALEDYLRGQIPRESPASWGDLGGGTGMQELEAQAVAGRSYALSSNYNSFSNICDSTTCQVYGGVQINGTHLEDSRTDAAVAATAGQVRMLNGAIARTEYSSSTGGYTAGGTFPAVVDDGDSVAQNPNHNWTQSISVSSIQNAYPSIGTLQTITIDSRNGLGDFGGRVNSLTVRGSNGNVSVSGTSFQSAFGLKSTWFRVNGVPSGGIGGYWITASDGGIFSFGSATFHGSMGGQHLNQPVVGMAATPSGGGYWLDASDGGIFSFGDAGFYGSTGSLRLNKPVVGMAPTPSGHGYWLVASDGGIFAFGDAGFYGSTGAIHLNQPVVGMAPTPSGHGYWLVASDGGIFAFGDAAFQGSTGGIKLNQPVVGMAATASGNGYWLVASDGGIFSFGDAAFFGSAASSKVGFSGMAASKTGNGYILVSSNGSVYSYGDAPDFQGIPDVVIGYTGHALSLSAVAG